MITSAKHLTAYIRPESKVVLYARYSTDMQNPKSCDDQFRVIRQHLGRLGIDHSQAVEIKDEGISGTDNERPGYQSVLKLIAQKGIKLLAVDEQSRLTRNLDASSVIKDLEFGGGRFIAVNDGIDTANTSWALVSSLRAAINHDSIEATGNRVRRGREGRVRDGLSAGDFPFGYKSVYVDTDPMKLYAKGKKPQKAIRICESEAETVRKTFQMFVQGFSIGAIARELRAAGLPSNNRKGDSDWKNNNVLGIIRNPKYTGRWTYGQTRVLRDSQGKTRQVPTKPDQHVEMFFPDRVIISNELWEAAQSRIRQNKEKWGYKEGQKVRAPLAHHRGAYPSSMLSCWIRCRCGSIMHNVGHRGKQNFVCPNSKRDRKLCSMRTTIPTKRAERLILEAVLSEFATIDTWQSVVYIAMKKHVAELSELSPIELKSLERRKHDIDSKITKLLSIVEDGGEFPTSVRERLKTLETESKAIDQQIQKQRALSEISASLPTLEWFNEQMKDQVALLQSEGPASWHLLRKLISPIVAEPVIFAGKERGFARLSFEFNCSAAFHDLANERVNALLDETDSCKKRIVIDAGSPTRVDEVTPMIVELRDAGLKWREIAERLGMKAGNLCTYYKRFKEGQKLNSTEANPGSVPYNNGVNDSPAVSSRPPSDP